MHAYALSIIHLCTHIFKKLLSPSCIHLLIHRLVVYRAPVSCVLFAVQASRSFLTVSASALPASKKRKQEPPASDSPHKVSMMPVATSPLSLPDNTCTASHSATAVSTSNTGAASAVPSACPAPLADVVTASGSTAVPSTTAVAPSFPLEHYEVTLAQMQAANYPLPAESANGQKVLPMGFVAANKGQAIICMLWGAACFVHVHQENVQFSSSQHDLSVCISFCATQRNLR